MYKSERTKGGHGISAVGGLVSLALVGAVILACVTPSHAQITRDEAIEILCRDVLMKDGDEPTACIVLPDPLEPGTEVISEDREVHFEVEARSWFAYVDDAPCALFEHGVRYILINEATGELGSFDAGWPPRINDTIIYKMDPYIEVLSIVDTRWAVDVPLTPGAAIADYGDAPDNTDSDTLEAYDGVLGGFPTLETTGNSDMGAPGCHALNIGEEMLGTASSCTVSAEAGASDPMDPDGVPNLVDGDSDEGMLLILDGSTVKLVFNVCVNDTAPDVPRYINALIDFDRDGRWDGSAMGTEWAITNLQIDVPPDTNQMIITQGFQWGDGIDLPSPAWMRILLSREQVDSIVWEPYGGWDGSGQFEYGEVSDFLVFLQRYPEIFQGGYFPPPPPDCMAPGPWVTECGDSIRYHAIIVNAGDPYQFVVSACPMIENSANRMSVALGRQGYSAFLVDLRGCEDSLDVIETIETSIAALEDTIRCGDRAFIYWGGHGGKKRTGYPGGVAVYDSAGWRITGIAATDLNRVLNIRPCPWWGCAADSVCCHVTILIDACYAGHNFLNVIPRLGRLLLCSSAGVPAYGLCSGVLYTRAFSEALCLPEADTDVDFDVEPIEAHVYAEQFLERHEFLQFPVDTSLVCSCDPGPTAVELNSFTANPFDCHIEVQWRTTNERDNAGFNVYRSLDKAGERLMLNSGFIAGKGDDFKGAVYSFKDLGVTEGVTYYYWLEDIDFDGKATMHGPVTAALASVRDKPTEFTLAQNHPNPFRAVTEIRYGLPVDTQVGITIYNLAGRKVRNLVNEHQAAGYRIAHWDGKNDAGAEVSDGIYFYKIEADAYSDIRKMILLR